MPGFENDPDRGGWRWGPNDDTDTADNIARLFAEGALESKSRPSRTKKPPQQRVMGNELGGDDMADILDGIEQMIISNEQNRTIADSPLCSPKEKKPHQAVIDDQVEEFYMHCAGQFFKNHFSVGVQLDTIEIEGYKLLVAFEDYKTNFGFQLKENRITITDEGLRADLLLEEMDFDELFVFASRMVNYYLDQVRHTRPGSLESNTLLAEANFWDTVGSIIAEAQKQYRKGVKRRE